MKPIYIDIDTQHDFMDSDGALSVPGAAKLVPNIARLYAAARERGIPVIATMDAHSQNDPEFEEYGFPPHCVRGTHGQEKIPATIGMKNSLITREGTGELSYLPPQVIIEKVAFSVFTNPHAENLILRRVPQLAGITPGEAAYVVFGVATDYCVKAAAIGLAERGAKVFVVEDAIAPVEEESGKSAVDEMKSAGVVFISTDEALSLGTEE
jgi:nicotinamidase/pyrazinamidase